MKVKCFSVLQSGLLKSERPTRRSNYLLKFILAKTIRFCRKVKDKLKNK